MKNKSRKRRGGLSPHKYLSAEQKQKLKTYLDERCKNAGANSQRAFVNRMIIFLLVYTGLRAAELCSLKIRDLPFYHGKSVLHVVDGKGQITRTVDMPAAVTLKLCDFVDKYRRGARSGSHLFVGENNLPLQYHSLWQRIKTAGKNAGVKSLHPHMLRHTYLMGLYNIKQDLRFVQDQAGHADPRTTAIYAHTDNPQRKEQVESLVSGDFF